MTESQRKAPMFVTDEENEQFSEDVSNFKGTDPEATKRALKQFLKRRTAPLAEPAPEPVAWSMTYNGNHCGNFYESRTDAEERMADMNAKHPLDKRAIEPLYAAPVREPAPVPLLTDDEKYVMIDHVTYNRWSLLDLVNNTETTVHQKTGLK